MLPNWPGELLRGSAEVPDGVFDELQLFAQMNVVSRDVLFVVRWGGGLLNGLDPRAQSVQPKVALIKVSEGVRASWRSGVCEGGQKKPSRSGWKRSTRPSCA